MNPADRRPVSNNDHVYIDVYPEYETIDGDPPVVATGSTDDQVAQTPASEHEARDEQRPCCSSTSKRLTVFVIVSLAVVAGGLCEFGYVSISVLLFIT